MGNSASSAPATVVQDDLKQLEEEVAKVKELEGGYIIYSDENGNVKHTPRPVHVMAAPDPKVQLKEATGHDTEDKPGPVLFELMESLLGVSNLVYSFSIMRDLAKKKLKVPVEGTGYWFGWGREYEDVELKGKSIVMTQDDLTRSVESECQHLKRTIKANDLIDFIDLNFHLYERFPDEEINGHKGDALNAKSILYGLRAEEGELFEFDDEFDGEELVYAITINHTDKRVVIIFRGSVWGGSDWPTNLKVSMEKIDTPPVLVETNLEEDIMIHRGFKQYLMVTPTTCNSTNPHNKLHCIMDNLKRVYDNPKHKDYELYVTGHSLGGALAALLAFTLAGSDKLENVPRPITAVTFAAPNVGGTGYLNAFQALEKAKLLRHVRVSNNDDVVNVSPPGLGWFGGIFTVSGYTQTGININLFAAQAMKIAYRGINKRFVDSIGVGNKKFHSLKIYRQRLLGNGNKETLERLSVEQIYGDDKYQDEVLDN